MIAPRREQIEDQLRAMPEALRLDWFGQSEFHRAFSIFGAALVGVTAIEYALIVALIAVAPCLASDHFTKVLRQRRHDKPVTALTFPSKLAPVPRNKSCSLMSVFKLGNDHPLTKAGLRCVHAVE